MMVSNKPTLLLAVFLLGAGCAAPPDTARDAASPGTAALDLPAQPNILWLVAEDMSPYLAAYGDPTVDTPHLDRLAREGVRYTNVYSVSGVCAPSRFTLATGTYTTSGGAQNHRTSSPPAMLEPLGLSAYQAVPAADVRMMSEVLRAEGYFTTNRAKTDYQFAPPVTAWDESNNRAHWRNRPAGVPFFSVFNFGVTHESRVWAKADDPLLIDADADVPIPPYLPDTEVVRRDVRRVYSNVAELDQQVGAILADLEADGLLDSTVIVFYADHGGPLPRQKRRLYDSGLHVPMFIRFPDAQRAGEVDEQLISFVDFAPAMFSLAGIEPPDYLEGQAFLGEFRAGEPRRYVYAAADRFDAEFDTIRAVRDARFKYIRNFRPDVGYYLPVEYRERMATMQEMLRLRDAGQLDAQQAQWFRPSKPEEELFDTATDPHELHDLAADPAYADVLTDMRAELDRWMRATGDPAAAPESELVERLWPGGVQPRTQAPVASRLDGVISLRSETEGASVGYQFLAEDQAPGDAWQVYTTPISLPPGQRMRVVAHRIGFAPSEVVEIQSGRTPGLRAGTAPGDATVALVNGRIFDGQGGPAVEAGVVVVRGQRIVAAGPADQVEIPRGAERIDVDGATIMPGVIDSHVHLFPTLTPRFAAGQDIVTPWIEAGVTTLVDTGSIRHTARASRALLQSVPHPPRFFMAGPIITVPGGYPTTRREQDAAMIALEVQGPEDAAEKVAALIDEEGVDLIKVAIETGFQTDYLEAGWPTLSPDELRAIVQSAHERGATVRAHVTNPGELEAALDAGLDALAHTPIHPIPDELLRRAADAGLIFTSTANIWGSPRGDPVPPNLFRYHSMGGVVAIGTDHPYQRGSEMPLAEMALLVAAGFTPSEVLVCATRNGARALGLEDELGTLQAGRLADLIVVAGRPDDTLDALRDVRLVMRNGEIVRR
jgi:arylsulfatase A-like enzyme/imidazolonepropionase-like amidohydrolase